MVDLWRRGPAKWFVCTAACFAAGCGSRSDPEPAAPPPATPPPPPAATLAAPGESEVNEADNPTVEVTLQLERSASGDVTVALEYTGTATRGRDYAAADSLTVPAGSASASTAIDIYRDFDVEGDETITVGVGAITGEARPGSGDPFTVTVLDGESLDADRNGPDIFEEPETVLLPFEFTIGADAATLAIGALNFSEDGASLPLVVEWSTDFEFRTGVHSIGTVDIPAEDDDPFVSVFPEPHAFALPLSRLAPSGHYFIRAYLGAPPDPDADPQTAAGDVFVEGFATDAHGHVATRCEARSRTPGAAGTDPLYGEQWHLVNTGQTAFSNLGGAAGEDLRMSAAIDAGHDGGGVTLAIVDSGLEICHPDLAANAEGGHSYNFAHESFFGASPADPFNPSTMGDHGTSVAGVAAAVARNGRGGRGVAPGVTLVGFNMGAAAEEDPELALLRALGGSDREPDSAAVDVFNMSFGLEEPAANASEDMVRLFEMGTSELRGGRGAIYVKAAGNEFSLCDSLHPLSAEIGCISANADPMQNLPYLIAVGGFNADGVKSSYSSAGANLWVSGPAGEDGLEAPAMITTDQSGVNAGFGLFGSNALTRDHPLNRDGDYMGDFGGTSSASPAVAGAAAVLLGVNPELTWRDVKHILAASARPIDTDRARVRAAFNGRPYVAQHRWQTNAAGYRFHNWYGFGAVDIDAAVALASSHAPDSLGEFVESAWFDAGDDLSLEIPDADGAGVTSTMEVAGLPEEADLEAVIVEIRAEHRNALDLGVTLHSPAGTSSIVNPPFNAVLTDYPGLQGWRLLSNAFYGEAPNGGWSVHVADLAAGDRAPVVDGEPQADSEADVAPGRLVSWRLRFYYGSHP